MLGWRMFKCLPLKIGPTPGNGWEGAGQQVPQLVSACHTEVEVMS